MIPCRRARGFTLLEVIVFIVVSGLVLAGLVVGMYGALRSSGEPKVMHQALQLAQGRMELILAQRSNPGNDFAGFSNATFDPCAAPGGAQEACLAPTGYTVVTCFFTAAGTCAFGAANTCQAADANFKCVRVRVTGPKGTVEAEIDAMVANY